MKRQALSQPQANAINDFSIPSKIKRRGRRNIAGNKRNVAGSKKISSGGKKTKLSMLNSASLVKSPSLLANDASNDFSIPGKSRRQSLGRRKMSRKPANVQFILQAIQFTVHIQCLHLLKLPSMEKSIPSTHSSWQVIRGYNGQTMVCSPQPMPNKELRCRRI